MPAEVYEETLHTVYCPDCRWSSDIYDSERDAYNAAQDHDAEQHPGEGGGR